MTHAHAHTGNSPHLLAGSSLRLAVQVLDQAGAACPLTNVEVSAIARNESGRVKANLVVEWIDRAAGLYELWAPGDGTCAGWDAGDYKVSVLYCEIGAGTGGRDLVFGTETFVVTVYI